MHKEWRAALYMRLSKEDERRGESESIETQRKILLSFCREMGIFTWNAYIDDGFSGTNLENRPAMQRMLSDIRNKKINLVLTKDLSRLGRNIGDTANLIDRFFPEHRVRFISVTDGIDTEKRDRSQRILTPLHNFTNELYSADISDKIHAALRIKMESGEYIGSFAPYGYEKDKENKNYLVPDKMAVEVVKRIFTLAAEGETPAAIASVLNKENIKTPSLYRAEKYPKSTNAFPKTEKWTASMVGKILRNEVYLGNTLQGKTEKPSFKSKATYAVPKESWIVVRGTHQPLIDYKTWQAVRNQMKKRAPKKNTGFRNQLSGIAVCADCGRNMSTAFSRGVPYLVCGRYKAEGRKKCDSHRIAYAKLLSEIKEALSSDSVGDDFLSLIRYITVEKEKDGEQHVHVFLREDM